MPAITYSEWSGGLDHRLPLGVADANRLWTLRNAYVTTGKKIVKRPGLRDLGANLTGTVGLSSINGELTVFAEIGGGMTTAPTGTTLVLLTKHPNPDGSNAPLIDVVYAENFQGYPYAVGYYDGNVAPFYRHHYIDGTTDTRITDTNCPHGGSVTKAASRIFSIADDVVRFCAAGSARDWTTSSDAGFLSVSLQQDTRGDPTAVGTFEDTLVVFFADGSQVWDVAVDPTANQIRRRMYGIGTTHPQSLASFYRDLVFASPFGVRSMSVQEVVNRFDETDVGVPVDKLVTPTQARHDANSLQRVRALWIAQFGQYWLIYDNGAGSTVFAYSFSRSSKLACWSQFDFPVTITGMAARAGKVYVRSAEKLYEVSADQFTDDGTPIAVDVQMAYQDAKMPGVEKMFYGGDFVFSGTATISYLFDTRDTTKETTPQTVTGDSRPGTLVPVELSSAVVAPRFQHSADEAFSVDLVSLYFHPLTAQIG